MAKNSVSVSVDAANACSIDIARFEPAIIVEQRRQEALGRCMLLGHRFVFDVKPGEQLIPVQANDS